MENPEGCNSNESWRRMSRNPIAFLCCVMTSFSTPAQEADRPDPARKSGQIICDALRLGDPASKEREAGFTGMIAVEPEGASWAPVYTERGLGRIARDGQFVAFLVLKNRGQDG